MRRPELVSITLTVIGFVIRFGIAFAIIAVYTHMPLALTAKNKPFEEIRHLIPDLLVVLYGMGAFFLERQDFTL